MCTSSTSTSHSVSDRPLNVNHDSERSEGVPVWGEFKIKCGHDSCLDTLEFHCLSEYLCSGEPSSRGQSSFVKVMRMGVAESCGSLFNIGNNNMTYR